MQRRYRNGLFVAQGRPVRWGRATLICDNANRSFRKRCLVLVGSAKARASAASLSPFLSPAETDYPVGRSGEYGPGPPGRRRLVQALPMEGRGMRSVSAKEPELKLRLTPQELRRIGAHPALDDLTVGKPVTRTQRSIYFDTPDHRLRARGISLRLRAMDDQKGDRWLQTVEAGKEVRNGVSNPDESEAVVGGPEPDLSAIDDRKLRQVIARAVRRSTLEPQFETIVTRTTRRLHSDKGDLDLALDEGVVRAGAAEDKLCEAELELKAGSPECLLETAAALFSSEPIRLAEESTVERGYNLVLGRSDPRRRPLQGGDPGPRGRRELRRGAGAVRRVGRYPDRAQSPRPSGDGRSGGRPPVACRSQAAA